MGTHHSMQRSLCLAVLLVAFLALAQSSSSTTQATSGYTSGGGGGGQSNTQIVQVVTFSFAHSDYTGALKALVEKSYGLSLGIYTTAGGWTTGCTVTSVAVAARRASSVTFTATVTPAAATTARTNSQALTPTILTNHINTVKSGESAYSGVAAITVNSVAAPTITGGSTTTSGSSKLEVGMAAMLGSVLLAMSMRH